MASSFKLSFVEEKKELLNNILASLNCLVQYKRTSLAFCVEESAWNVLIFLEILFALHLVSRLKHSLKDTVNPICNQLLASLSQQSSTQALAPEKERIIGGAR